MRHLFVKRLELVRSAHDVFAWHEQPDSLRKLIPPGEPVRVGGSPAGQAGSDWGWRARGARDGAMADKKAMGGGA